MPGNGHQRIELEDVGDVTVVTFRVRVLRDELLIQQVGDDLARLVDELRRRKLLLDFSNVERLATALIGKLVWLNEHLKKTGGKLVLCGISPNHMEIFQIMRLDRMMTIVKDVQAGLDSF